MNPLRTLKNYFFPDEMNRILREAHTFPRYTQKEIDFRGFKITMTDYLSVAYQLLEIFEEERLQFKATGPEPLIYDCGANVGIVSLYLKSKYPNARIVAFEPDAKVFSCLKKNIEENKLSGIELNEAAVWINNSGIEFGAEGADGGSVYFDGKKTKVKSVRLAELLEKEKAIDLLKIDIEGAENDVLPDCEPHLKKVKNLFLEYHSWSGNEQQLDTLLAILRRSGFRYTIHSIGGVGKQPFLSLPVKSGMDIQLDIHAVNLGYKA
jgi:FkbM family methyltransferase